MLNPFSLLFVAGDSFVVNACLARKGLDDWLVKQKYYCSGARLEQQDCPQKSTCGASARVRDLSVWLVSWCIHIEKHERSVSALFHNCVCVFCALLVRSPGACVPPKQFTHFTCAAFCTSPVPQAEETSRAMSLFNHIITSYFDSMWP